jgi:hypothetical protein
MSVFARIFSNFEDLTIYRLNTPVLIKLLWCWLFNEAGSFWETPSFLVQMILMVVVGWLWF